MLTLNSARSALHDANVRLTPQRLMVVDVLIGNQTHPTVEQVYEVVKQHYPTISLATVYKTLALLARNGLICELQGARDGLRYDPNTVPHAHTHCLHCGTLHDVPLSIPLYWDEYQLAGFKLDHVEVTLTGYCAQCIQTKSDE